MMRRMVLSLCLVACCIWCVAVAARVESAPPGPGGDAAFKPAASLESLMRGQRQQFEAIGVLLQDTNARSRTKRLVTAAELLAEFANVNMHHKGERQYRDFAQRLRDTSLGLATEAKKAAKADEAKMRGMVESLESTCNACHDVYQ